MDSGKFKAPEETPLATTLAATRGGVLWKVKRTRAESKQPMTIFFIYCEVYRIIKSLRAGTGLADFFFFNFLHPSAQDLEG